MPYAENIMGSNLLKKTETHGNSLLSTLWKETVKHNSEGWIGVVMYKHNAKATVK